MDVLSRNIRTRAAELGLSDAELGRRTGLSPQRLSNYLNGHREPDLATLLRLCNVLTTTPNALLLESAHRPDTSEGQILRDRITAATAVMDDAELRRAVALMEALAREVGT